MGSLPDYFDEPVAATYDQDVADMFDATEIEPVLDVLEGLCGEKGALEFGIGTGRIALPLSQRGVRVSGIDLSAAMMARLSGKPGAEKIQLIEGSFSDTRVERQFDLVYLVFNTIMNLTSQEAQLACFQNAADHLVDGGHFVIEVMTPRLQWLNPGEKHMIWDFTDQHRGVDEYEIATQGLTSHHTYFKDGIETSQAIPFRYVWPAELDLMAKLAGMQFDSRWQDWQKTPFVSDSRNQIAIWQKGE